MYRRSKAAAGHAAGRGRGAAAVPGHGIGAGLHRSTRAGAPRPEAGQLPTAPGAASCYNYEHVSTPAVSGWVWKHVHAMVWVCKGANNKPTAASAAIVRATTATGAVAGAGAIACRLRLCTASGCPGHIGCRRRNPRVYSSRGEESPTSTQKSAHDIQYLATCWLLT
jgi:hypothetical protein